MATSIEGWPFMKAGDAISGNEGALYATINGEQINVAECKSITAKITKEKSEFKALGYRGKQFKAKGWSGEGTLVLHYATSRFTEMMIDYAKTGVDVYFTLQIVNCDPTSSVGTQKINLMDVNLDDVEVAKLNTESDFLDQSIGFTFSDIDIEDKFKDINS